MTPTGRLYSDYHDRVFQTLHTVLQNQNICFDLLTPQNKLDRTRDCLLVVWSEDVLTLGDFLDDTHDRCFGIIDGLSSNAIVDQLSSCGRPVLWLTAVDRAYLDFKKIGSNIKFLHYGGDIMFGMKEYPAIAPQRKKSFDTVYASQWISLNHIPSLHRILAACCLLGHDLGNQISPRNRGLLRISNSEISDYESLREYVQGTTRNSIHWSQSQDLVLQEGFVKLKKNLNGGQPAGNIYRNLKGADNPTNFDRSLRLLYQNSMIEIVNETSFFSKGIFVTEKFQNSVYGFNLPIIMSNAGTVAYLRAHGFDMFDDVIDHSYDSIGDPVDRIFAAVEKNFRLLTDFDYAKSCYQRCLPRLEHNYQYIKEDMYEHFIKDFTQNLQDYLNNEYGIS